MSFRDWLAGELRNGMAPAVITGQTFREVAAAEGFEIPEFRTPAEFREFVKALVSSANPTLGGNSDANP